MREAMLNSIAAIPFEADPWLTGFTVFGVVIILGLIAWIVRSFLQPTVYIEAVDSLLTTTEQKFYEALDIAVHGRVLVLSKIRVADLFNVSSESRSARQKVFWSVACKHVDFALVEADILRPIAAIELDDASHQRADRQERDRLLDNLFEKANLPLLRFPTAMTYDPRAIQARIDRVLTQRWEKG
jgi:very-short-patch-repair endonuclease